MYACRHSAPQRAVWKPNTRVCRRHVRHGVTSPDIAGACYTALVEHRLHRQRKPRPPLKAVEVFLCPTPFTKSVHSAGINMKTLLLRLDLLLQMMSLLRLSVRLPVRVLVYS